MVILESAQIRAWDEYTITSQGIVSYDLMKKAGSACVSWISENLGSDLAFQVYCNKGNNGGDGLVIASLLSQLGHQVDVYIIENGKKGTNDFQLALEKVHDTPVRLHYISSIDTIPSIKTNACIIDALFGIGMNRELDELNKALVSRLNESTNTIISIDMPSGMRADSFNDTNLTIKANHTLSFACYKLAFLHASAEEKIGKLHILDIGLDKGYLKTLVPKFQFITQSLAKTIYKPRPRFSHKGHFGHALLVAGSTEMPGAGLISANSCLRAGAGKTDWWSPLLSEFPKISVPEVMFPRNPLTNPTNYSAIGIGPGLGTSPNSKKLVQELLSLKWEKMVLDADALNVLAMQPELLTLIPQNSILTPHPKEFKRLLSSSGLNEASTWESAALFAKKYHCILVLKGRYTMIFSQEGICYVNTTGNPGLSKGGSGDALTGFILGLLAQPSYPSFEAAILGVYLHGRAADLALASQSEESLIASDLANYIGMVFKELS